MGRKDRDAATTAVTGSSSSEPSWGCGGVKWGRVFQHQSHAGWLVLLAAACIIGISHFSITPNVRPLRIYDASISLPWHPDTVSIELAGIIPFAALIITVLAVEFGAMWKRQSLTMSIHAMCHIIWWAIIGFAVVLAITEATKPFASRYRPDYLSRCKVIGTQDNQTVLKYKAQGECDKQQMQTPDVKDGRKSFPSGHSSNSLSLCWFTVLYFVHALYWRDGLRYMRSVSERKSCGMRFLGELLQGLFIIWGLGVVAIAWCIGVSRFRDNKHNIDDILGGFMAALLWMTPCTFIALGQLNYYQQRLRAAEEEDKGTLPVVGLNSKAVESMNNAHNASGALSPTVSGGGNNGTYPYGSPAGAAAAAGDSHYAQQAHLSSLTSDIGTTPGSARVRGPSSP